MAVQLSEPRRLCYLSADRIEGPFPRRDRVDVRSREGRRMGNLDGVIIDPAARQVRYLVIDRAGLFTHHRYLLPFPPAQVDVARRALCVDLDMNELAHCSEFDRASYPDFSDDDLLAALFPSRHEETVN